MSELIYIDTNIWLDYYLDRGGKYISLRDIAFEIFRRSVSCEFKIIISRELILELEKMIPKNKLNYILNWLHPKLVFVNTGNVDIKKAKKFKIHYPDCVHVYLARKYNSILVSNDKEMQDFGAISSRTL